MAVAFCASCQHCGCMRIWHAWWSVSAAASDATPKRNDCWEHPPLTYIVCCACGNSVGNITGVDMCFDSHNMFTLETCCHFYGDPKVLPSLPCWRDHNGLRKTVQFELGNRPWLFFQEPSTPFTPFSDEEFDMLMPRVLWASTSTSEFSRT